MNTTTITRFFAPAAAAEDRSYDALRLTEEEFSKLSGSGHRCWTTIPPSPADIVKRLGIDQSRPHDVLKQPGLDD